MVPFWSSAKPTSSLKICTFHFSDTALPHSLVQPALKGEAPPSPVLDPGNTGKVDKVPALSLQKAADPSKITTAYQLT